MSFRAGPGVRLRKALFAAALVLAFAAPQARADWQDVNSTSLKRAVEREMRAPATRHWLGPTTA